MLSAAIDKYVYVTVSPSFDGRVHLHYSKIEVVDDASELQHDIVRAALAQAGISRGIEIHTIADVTGEGTGLGSSSALAVGLVNALNRYKRGSILSFPLLAKMACEIEIDRLHKPIGEQDQYIAAYGGMYLLEFGSSHNPKDKNVGSALWPLEDYILLFDTGIARNANTILGEQNARVEHNAATLNTLAAYARSGYEKLKNNEYESFGKLMHMAWEFKRTLASNITNSLIDSHYDAARSAGAWGGKICGAGGGGYLLLIASPDAHSRIRSALALPEMRVRLGVEGSTVREI